MSQIARVEASAPQSYPQLGQVYEPGSLNFYQMLLENTKQSSGTKNTSTKSRHSSQKGATIFQKYALRERLKPLDPNRHIEMQNRFYKQANAAVAVTPKEPFSAYARGVSHYISMATLTILGDNGAYDFG